MEPTEKARFEALYQQHLRALKLRGMSDSTIDVYALAVRRLAEHCDCCPDQLSQGKFVLPASGPSSATGIFGHARNARTSTTL